MIRWDQNQTGGSKDKAGHSPTKSKKIAQLSKEALEAREEKRKKKVSDLSLKMIKETEQFLSYAEKTGKPLPVIPTRRASQGGFEFAKDRPGAKAMIHAWWQRALNMIARYET